MPLRPYLLPNLYCALAELAPGWITANLDWLEAAAVSFPRAMALAPDWPDPAFNLEAALRVRS